MTLSQMAICLISGDIFRIDLAILPIEKPKNGNPGRVHKQKTYHLTPGVAYLYNEGDLHSPRRTDETRLIRVEGINMATVQRDKYEISA